MSDFLPEVIGGSESESDNESETIEEITEIKQDDNKTKIEENDIFIQDGKPEKQDKPLEIKEVVEEKPKKKEKKERKKRPPMTEEHKQKLKLAREKALETRRKNAARKKEIKQLQKEEEELKYNELKNRVRKPKAKKEPVEEDQFKIKDTSGVLCEEIQEAKRNGYTQEDLDKAVLNGIIQYDTIRKQRKKKKQEEKDLMKHEEKVKEQIRRTIQPEPNFFDNCY